MQQRTILDQANRVLRQAQLRVAGLTLNSKAPLRITVTWNNLGIPVNTLVWVAALLGKQNTDGSWADLTYSSGGSTYVYGTIASITSAAPPVNNISSILNTLAPDVSASATYDVKALVLLPTSPYPTADYWGNYGVSPNRLRGFIQSQINGVLIAIGGVGVFTDQLAVNALAGQAGIVSVVLSAA